jgi:iron complex transport system permease protein
MTVKSMSASSTGRLANADTLLLACLLVLAVAAVLALSIGPTGITLDSLPRVLTAIVTGEADAGTAREKLVLLDIRLPRLLLGMFVGIALSTSGAMMQGLFRNPLADPGLIGVSSGAALAAVATIALGNGVLGFLVKPLGVYALPFMAFLGGVAATSILVMVADRHGQLITTTLLLAGIGVGALAAALTGLISFASDDRELRDLTLWMLGSLSGASWPKVFSVIPFALVLAAVCPRLIRALNGLLLGETEAFHMGVDVERSKKLIVLATASAVGAAVAVSGVIGFVGIVVPHFARMLGGPDHRCVLPVSATLGATLVLLGDVVARLALSPAELPLGVVMAIIGAPVFLHMVIRRGLAGA